ncbi:MAG: hypothetical protein KJ558_03740, partial [Gammaproteobacteria bacterium]|nr:hypothetical protein [Gammaproteobacteria bacterium]MBU1962603.1 hypothetical protein [Gammaproteobacteria bacterium]
ESKEAESKEAESKEAESKEAESKEAESKEAESKEAESKEAESKEAQSKGARQPFHPLVHNRRILAPFLIIRGDSTRPMIITVKVAKRAFAPSPIWGKGWGGGTIRPVLSGVEGSAVEGGEAAFIIRGGSTRPMIVRL